MSEKSAEKLDLYLHIPFCKSKCAYCSFYSLPNQSAKVPVYFQCLQQELKEQTEILKKAELNTIYIGGGTPSLVPAEVITEIIDWLSKTCKFSTNCEITIEANPETLTKQSLTQYQLAGINRLSLGLQATQDKLLQAMGRHYSFSQFLEIYQLARETGWQNLNLDLIFGLPGQTLQDWQETLEKVLDLNPEHLACYSLELEEGSFWGNLAIRNKLADLPTDKLDRQMYQLARKLLVSAGYQHYEISNFAKPGKLALHNLNFWRGQAYLGCGAAAHSYIPSAIGPLRFNNPESIDLYCSQVLNGSLSNQRKLEKVNFTRQIAEFLLLHLRLKAGFQLSEFTAKFGKQATDTLLAQLANIDPKGLLKRQGNTVKLTAKGLNLYNRVIIELIYNYI